MSLLNLQNLKTKKEPKYIKKIIQSIDDKPLSNDIINSIKEIKPNSALIIGEGATINGTIKENTIKMFKAGCNIALHCNGNFKEMEIVGKNSPLINQFIYKKTSQFYKIIS